MKKIFTNIIPVLFFVLTAGSGYSQGELITDRPDQTESSEIVPKGYVQFELGGAFENDKFEDDSKIETISFPSLLTRFGIFKVIELRAVMEYNMTGLSVNNTTANNEDFTMAIGTKVKFFEEKGARPGTSLIVHLNTSPVYSWYKDEGFTLSPDIRFTFQNTLSDKLALSYNLGTELDNKFENPVWLYTLSLGSSFNKKLGLFGEFYGFLQGNSLPDHRFDGGLTYKIRPNLQADLSGGLGITSAAPDYFIGAGISYRIPK